MNRRSAQEGLEIRYDGRQELYENTRLGQAIPLSTRSTLQTINRDLAHSYLSPLLPQVTKPSARVIFTPSDQPSVSTTQTNPAPFPNIGCSMKPPFPQLQD